MLTCPEVLRNSFFSLDEQSKAVRQLFSWKGAALRCQWQWHWDQVHWGKEEPFVTTSPSCQPLAKGVVSTHQLRKPHSVKSAILHASLVLYYFWACWILEHSLRGIKKKANSVNLSIFTAFAKLDIFQSNCEKHTQSLPTAWFSSYKIPLNQTHFEIKENLLENFIALLDTYSKINHLSSFCIPGIFLSLIFFAAYLFS